MIDRADSTDAMFPRVMDAQEETQVRTEGQKTCNTFIPSQLQL